MQLSVNGKIHKFNDDPQMPLLWALRDILNLKGTKFGCGKGLCGACTIHIEGEAVKSCLVPVQAAVGHKVTTIEGLSSDASHPLQKAWQDLNVAQCGYCQGGQIMCAASLLAKQKAPTDADIDTAMSGNICRCGTYVRIRAAIKVAAQKMGSP